MDYKIVDVDFWENDAILEFDGDRLYFQFSKEPTLAEALAFLFAEGKIEFKL